VTARSRTRPHGRTRPEPSSLGPLEQGAFELAELDGGELGRVALAGRGAQRPSPALLTAGMPAAGRLG
jgi:hypothetical protein